MPVKRCMLCSAEIAVGKSYCREHSYGRYRWKKTAAAVRAASRPSWCSGGDGHAPHPVKSPKDLVAGHIVSRVQGGQDVVSNLRMICRALNAAERGQ